MGEDFNRECVQRHNFWRAKHGAPPLRHNAQLQRSAQAWAEQLAASGKLQHSPESQGKMGENVASKWVQGGAEFSGEQATNNWYSEIHDYTFGKENQITCGHFSQVVWKATTDAGFGRAVDPKGNVFVVGQYLPPANFTNKWNLNVPPPLNGKIEVPTENELRAMDQKEASSQSTPSKKLDGQLQPHSSADHLVGKQTKTKIAGGKKTVVLTETYQRPDGSTYAVTKETTSGAGTSTKQLNDMTKRLDLNGSPEKRNQTAPVDELADFRKDVLEAHNAYRRIYRVPPLTSDPELDTIAQQWAEHLAQSNSFKHSSNTCEGGKLGENIACKWGSAVNGCKGREVVHQWYDEESKYTFEENPSSLEAGHFTQVVWKSSQRLGVGYAKGDNNKFITVCNYFPPGNILGQFAENVPFPQ